MCEPISIGIATAVVGGLGAVAQYQQQQQQVAYSNAQAAQQAALQTKTALFQAEQYNRQVTFNNQNQRQQTFNQRDAVENQNLQTRLDYISQQQQRQYQGLQSQLQYQTELNKSIASQEYVNTQLSLNQSATSRSIMAEQQKLRDSQNQAAFEGQRLLATNLQTQGSVLGSGRTGQSIGLLVNDAERVYGQNAAVLNANARTAYGDYESNSAMSVLRQLNADADATSRLLPEPIKPMTLPGLTPPVFASMPEYGPNQDYMTELGPLGAPIFASGPGSIGLIAGIGGSVLGGVNAGLSSAALLKEIG